jgi:O-antigen ligase
LSDVLAAAGVLVAAGASATSILLPPGRWRAPATLAAIALLPALILGDQWHTAQIVDLRHHADRLIALGVAGLVATVALAFVFRRWPILLPLAIVAALPFRIPLEAGGDTANLLVPLYLVIASGALASAVRDWGGRPAGPGVGVGRTPWAARSSGGRGDAPGGSGPSPTEPPSGGVRPTPTPPPGAAVLWLPWVLAAVVILYALQAVYSPDFSKGLQNVCFFLVPFTVAYGLLRDVEWSRRLLRYVLLAVAIEAIAFVLIGSVEYAARGLFWNDQVIRSNEFHTYFRVNSVFWDPNIYGRYLALVIVVAMAVLLWAKERRAFALLTLLVAVLWIGLAQTFSQSSFVTLLAGLAVLAALRWSWRWTLGAVAVGAIGAVLVVTLVGGSGKVNFSRLNIDTSGRANLVSGGLDLFGERPVWGYGSGSFQVAYKDHAANRNAPVSVSHTEPVTVAAEQGIVGLSLYAALIAVALWTMGTGLGPLMPGIARSRLGQAPLAFTSARAAVLAAFVALLVHTMAYAGFFEDPIAWVLLALGASLAAAPALRDPA